MQDAIASEQFSHACTTHTAYCIRWFIADLYASLAACGSEAAASAFQSTLTENRQFSTSPLSFLPRFVSDAPLLFLNEAQPLSLSL